MKIFEDRHRARQLADRLQQEKLAAGGAFTDWFEDLYARADGDAGLVPWGDEEPHSGLVEWLQANPQEKGIRAIDVGCGLGDNAAYMAEQGLQTTAIDLSPTAVKWVQQRFSDQDLDVRVADLFDLPDDLVCAFSFVNETYTIQALPLELRPLIMEGISRLLAPGGLLLVICRGRENDTVPDGPPWPLSRAELEQFTRLGLSQESFECFDEHKPDGRIVPHFRISYRKPC